MTYKYKKIINSPSHSLPSIARPLVACQSKKGRGEPRSGEGEGLWGRGFGVFFCPLYYILSGTSMPSSAMPFLMVFATFWASTRRTAFSSALSAPRIE